MTEPLMGAILWAWVLFVLVMTSGLGTGEWRA